jgi:hypothetical protein
MSCDLTAGYSLGCRDSQGGIFYVIAIQKEDIAVNGITKSLGEVSAITLTSGSRGWKIEQEEETGMFEENPIGSRENGTFRVEENLSLVLNDAKKETRNLVNLLSKNRLVFVIAKNDGTFVLAGEERGMMLADGAGGSGTAKADRSGFTLPFTGVEKSVAPTIDPDIIAGLLVVAS